MAPWNRGPPIVIQPSGWTAAGSTSAAPSRCVPPATIAPLGSTDEGWHTAQVALVDPAAQLGPAAADGSQVAEAPPAVASDPGAVPNWTLPGGNVPEGERYRARPSHRPHGFAARAWVHPPDSRR